MSARVASCISGLVLGLGVGYAVFFRPDPGGTFVFLPALAIWVLVVTGRLVA